MLGQFVLRIPNCFNIVQKFLSQPVYLFHLVTIALIPSTYFSSSFLKTNRPAKQKLSKFIRHDLSPHIPELSLGNTHLANHLGLATPESQTLKVLRTVVLLH